MAPVHGGLPARTGGVLAGAWRATTTQGRLGQKAAVKVGAGPEWGARPKGFLNEK
jgi:hypothetical protein